MGEEITNSWISYTVERGPIRGPLSGKVGLRLTIKARPEIEALMSNLAKDKKIGTDAYGDLWYNCVNPDEPLEVYAVDPDLSGSGYTLNQVGQPLLVTPTVPRVRNAIAGLGDAVRVDGEIANISFLKLVGISRDTGVTLGLSGAYSSDYVMNRLKPMFSKAITTFLRDYIVPTTFNLHIISKG